MTATDTIAAIATPHGVGGIALLRIAGPQALTIALQLARTDKLLPRHATYCPIGDIDEGIVTYYPAPNSYTGDDTVELACHGSLFVQQTLLQALIDRGARLAEPGEFTLRAFRSGKLNLSQAEAVADLIDATTPTQHQLALSQLRGSYAQQLKELRQQLLDLTALLELELDFSQEDIQFADRSHIGSLVDRLTLSITRLTDSFATGQALKNGIPVAILGRPNAGKSSLLNALLNDDRAIVSPTPGTTRDTIEELLPIPTSHSTITFRFIDTAGLRQSDDHLETIGIDRSYRAAHQALVIIFLHDAQRPSAEALADIQALRQRIPLDGKHLIVAHNKCDLAQPDHPLGPLLSATLGTGIDLLKQTLVQQFDTRQQTTLLTNPRHYSALLRVQEALRHVDRSLHDGTPPDLIAVDLRDALYHLGTITGEVASSEVLHNIFSRFCIGK